MKSSEYKSKLLELDCFGHSSHMYLDCLNDTIISGNKLHKLKPNIALAQSENCNTVLSFGGPYSNHLHALAYASKESNLDSIGIVRGELHMELTPTLKDCQEWGMQLIPMQRKSFREIVTTLESSGGGLSSEILEVVGLHLPDKTWVIPEGGSNLGAIDSLAEAYRPLFELDDFTHVVCAMGTGATVAGIRKAAPKEVTVIGVQAVAEGDATMQRIKYWLGEDFQLMYGRLEIVEGHLGGFAKVSKELIAMIARFESEQSVQLDPIYNGKVIYKLMDMVTENYFTQQDNVLIIHTGGLQGKRGV